MATWNDIKKIAMKVRKGEKIKVQLDEAPDLERMNAIYDEVVEERGINLSITRNNDNSVVVESW